MCIRDRLNTTSTLCVSGTHVITPPRPSMMGRNGTSVRPLTMTGGVSRVTSWPSRWATLLPTESVMMCWFGSTDFLNVARKDLLASIVSANGLAVPVILPLHPVNSHPAAGFAVTVTVLPVSYTHLRAHETRHDLVCRL